MPKTNKLDIHPDRIEILAMLKQGTPHRRIADDINARYPAGSDLRISTAAISRYINREVSKPIELPESIQRDVEEIKQQKKKPCQIEAQKKVDNITETLEAFAMSETLQNNLISLIELLPKYISEGRDAKEIKALSEATKLYNDLLNSVKKTEDPEAFENELTYDDIKAVENDFDKN